MDLSGSRVHGGGMGGMYLRLAIGNEADMRGASFDNAHAQPERTPARSRRTP
jgi:hypothetical protein